MYENEGQKSKSKLNHKGRKKDDSRGDVAKIERKVSGSPDSKVVLGKVSLVSGCVAIGCNLIRRRQLLCNKSLRNFIITKLEVDFLSSLVI